MSDLQRKKRGAPKKAELGWKLEVVDALLWMGGGELTVWDAVRAVAQMRSDAIERQAEAPDVAARFTRVLEEIAAGCDVISDEHWEELDAQARAEAGRRYRVDGNLAPVGKAGRRYEGFVRGRRARLLRAEREGVSADAARRAVTAEANALQTAFYARAKSCRRAHADVVCALLGESVWASSGAGRACFWV